MNPKPKSAIAAAFLAKQAFVPMNAAGPIQPAQPPMDPAASGAMPPGGDPSQMDPNAADPSMMGQPPADPAAQGAPAAGGEAPPADPAAGAPQSDPAQGEQIVQVTAADLMQLFQMIQAESGGKDGKGEKKEKKKSVEERLENIEKMLQSQGGGAGAPSADPSAGGDMMAEGGPVDASAAPAEPAMQQPAGTPPGVDPAAGGGMTVQASHTGDSRRNALSALLNNLVRG